MQELKKILEEIDETIERYKENANMEAVDICYGMKLAKKIIRKHMNDGWIPVEKGLPEVSEDIDDDDCPEFNVTIDGADKATTLKCSSDGTFFDENGYVYHVIAWCPLPEPYRPERSVH